MKNVKHLLLSLRGSVALCPEDLALLLSPPIMGLEWVMSSGVLRPAENGTPSPVGSSSQRRVVNDSTQLLTTEMIMYSLPGQPQTCLWPPRLVQEKAFDQVRTS